jgi:hypothetical protein
MPRARRGPTTGCRADRPRTGRHRVRKPRGLRVGYRNVVPGDILGGPAGKGRKMTDEIGLLDVAEPDNRIEVSLRVEFQAICIDAAIEVHGELGESKQRPGAHERSRAISERESSRKLEFAIQPRVEEWTAIDLDSGLQPSEVSGARLRLQLEPRRIGVRTDNAVRRGRVCAVRLAPGNERAVTDHEERSCARIPRVGLVQPHEARGVKLTGGLRDGVERRRRSLDEVGEGLEVR